MHDDEIPVGKAKDLTGKQFGAWTVLYRTFNTNNGKHTNWKCRCNGCGIEKSVRQDQLLHGKNLGCIHCGTAKATYKNIVGQQIGNLLVLEDTTKRSNGAVIWKCKDIHTNDIVYRRTDLVYTYHSNKHIDKLNINAMSKPEIVIYFILQYNHIPFEMQKIFNTCKFPDTNSFARFDFYINNQYLLEYDGEPHFQEVSFFDGDLLKRQEHDAIKNKWCQDNNIPLIRIPYTHLNDLCIEDLLLETTPFRVA